MKKVLLFFLLCHFSLLAAEKGIYVPASMGDVNNESNNWSYARSRQSENFILFWEPGYGSNPETVANSSYRVNITNLLELAERSFAFYADSLKFITRGASKTDQYKMIIRLRYTTDWEATGSGVDDMIGLLTLTAWSGQAAGVTLAHEVGHCFQYQVHCDNNDQNGWMYGFGNNASGGNCFWEQCAQWQAYKIFPNQQFTNSNFTGYLKTTHKHIIHETPRYDNFYIHDYWTYLHGMDFIGRLWNESKRPEDPIQTYRRITGITYEDFNDEIYDCAARFATWDVPAIRQYGESKINSRPQPKMSQVEDNYWLIDSLNCPENYGHNIIKLNVPDGGGDVKVYFEGKAGMAGFRNFRAQYGGWRFGFVALKRDGTRVYGDMGAVTSKTPKDTLTFACPADCQNLWLVVTGAPTKFWEHAWDDNDTNDEQWPYQVKFENTNLYGVFDFEPGATPKSDTLTYSVVLAPYTGTAYPSTPVQPSITRICNAFCLSATEIQAAFGSSVKYCAVNNLSGTLDYNSTATAPGHWFNNKGIVTSWGNNTYIFSEFNTSNLTFNIGQYPNACREGDKFTIRQALVYQPSQGEEVKVLFIFNINISSVTSALETTTSGESIKLYTLGNTLTMENLPGNAAISIYDITGKNKLNKILNQEVFSTTLQSGIYIVKISSGNEQFTRKVIIK